MVALAALRDGKKAAAAQSDLAKMVAEPAERVGLEPAALMLALAETRLTGLFDSYVKEVLREHAYDAPTLSAIHLAVREAGRPIGLAERIAPLLGFIDPQGDLRKQQ